MIDIERQTDSLDGKDPGRQILIGITHLALLIGSWFTIKYLQYGLLCLANFDKYADKHISGMNHLPITIFLWGTLWYYIVIELGKGYYNPPGNHIQASYNPLSPEKLPEGGTRYIINQTGFGLAWLWQVSQGPPIQVENEIVQHCPATTITIKKISLEIQLILLYQPLLPSLSRFLQNSGESQGQLGALEQIVAAANQFVEESAARMDDTEEVRGNQTRVLWQPLRKLRRQASRLGIHILSINFSKCDYSSDTQKELNKLLEAKVVKDIADEMGLPDMARAYELAAVAAGKPGAKVTRSIWELVSDDNSSAALQSAGPAAVTLLQKVTQPKNTP